MTSRTRNTLRTIGNAAIVAAVLWYSLPARPPLAPYVWRSIARAAGWLSDTALVVCLVARQRYWQTVRP